MTKTLARDRLEGLARIVEAPRAPRETDRTFGLPTRLYGLTVGAYVAFLGITAVGFATGGLIIPIAICLIYVAMAFGVPTLWTRTGPAHRSRALTWAEFRRSGVATATGRMSAADATMQVLILPAVVFVWGLVCVAIAALTF